MTEDSEEWKHAGISEVNTYEKNGRKQRYIRIPDRIIGRKHQEPVEILKSGRPIYWSYDKTVKTVIVSKPELQNPDYKYVDTSKFSESNNFRTTIPARFFADFEGTDKYEVQSPVPVEARFTDGERRHFIFNRSMAQEQIKSCYVLTEEEFSIQFSDSDRWEGDLSQVPKFFS
jgi:hypothetical protein